MVVVLSTYVVVSQCCYVYLHRHHYDCYVDWTALTSLIFYCDVDCTTMASTMQWADRHDVCVRACVRARETIA